MQLEQIKPPLTGWFFSGEKAWAKDGDTSKRSAGIKQWCFSFILSCFPPHVKV